MAKLRRPSGRGAETLASTAHMRLRREIITAEFLPGTRLNTRDLCARYAIGLSPIREALSRLSSEGLVQQSDQRGFSVAPLGREDLEEVVRTRLWLNETGMRESIVHGDKVWEERLVVSFYRLSRLSRFLDEDTCTLRNPEWDEAHQRFHRALLQSCRSRWLIGFCEQIFDAFERYRNLADPVVNTKREHLEEHRAIMEAALARDADAAVKLLCDHFQQSAEMARQNLARDGG